MPLNPPAGRCQSQIQLDQLNSGIGIVDVQIIYYIGGVAITGLINVNSSFTIAQFQSAINADPTYQSSGTTITVISYNNFQPFGLIVNIEKSSSVQITDLAKGELYDEKGLAETTIAPFTCTAPVKKKSHGSMGSSYIRYPDELIFKSQDSPAQITYQNQLYNFYNKDEERFNHYIKSTSNINLRGTQYWWALRIG